MAKVEIVMEEAAGAPSQCAAAACDSGLLLRRWNVMIQVTDRDALAFSSVAPKQRQFVACDRHALPVAQYLIGEILLSDAMRGAAGMRPRAVG